MGFNSIYIEDELITLLKQGNSEAFSSLYDRYAPALYTVVLQIVRDKETANDLMNNIFLEITDKINCYNPAKERFFIWMFKIARNIAVDFIKSKNDRDTLKQTQITNKMLGEIANSEMDNYGLKKIMSRLKEEHKILVDLCYYQGFTHAEIARALNIPVDTVQPRLRIAFLELRTLL